MARPTLLILAVLLGSFQDPGRPQDSKPPGWFNFHDYDIETGEVRAFGSGLGVGDPKEGPVEIRNARITVFIKDKDREARERDKVHMIRLYSNRCVLEGVGGGDARDAVFQFSDGLRVMLDDEVRLWTTEGSFDLQTKILKCPGMTHVVQFSWPPGIDLASALVFMDPLEMDWLKAFGAPEPDFVLSGEEFEFDASTFSFTAGRKGRIRVQGNPADALRSDREKKPRKRPAFDPTELTSEGPLALRTLGSPEADAPTTLHLTGERNVLIEHRSAGGVARTRSDSASVYFSVPPENQGEPRPISAVLKGNVRLEESSGFTAAAEHVEWNHQEDLLRLSGAPLVEIRQGTQVLNARRVVVDRVNRLIDFEGDIAATFLANRTAAEPGAPVASMTMKPGDLQVRTDARGRPVGLHASRGVRLSNRRDTPGLDAIEADGTDFEWDLVTGEGSLRGSPFATLRQGTNLVVAPLVTFRGDSFDESLMVIKGPKLLRFFIELNPPRNASDELVGAALGLKGLRQGPARREPPLNTSAAFLEASIGLPGLQRIPERRDSVMDLVVSCDGDAVLDQKAGFVKLVDRCSVRAQDSTLTADRLFVFLTKTDDMSFDRVIGLGSVRASQAQGPGGASFRIEGETIEMRLDPALGSKGQRIVTIIGHPWGRGQIGPMEVQFEKATLNLDEQTLESFRGTLPLN